MNFFDIIVFAVCAISSANGVYKGSLKLTIGLISFALSLIFTELLFPFTKSAVAEHVSNMLLLNILSGVISYILSMLFCAFINNYIIRLISGISGGLIDRLLGFCLGASRGLVICWIIYGVVAIFTSNAHIGAKTMYDIVRNMDSHHYPNWLKNAISYNIISNSAEFCRKIISDEALKLIYLPNITDGKVAGDGANALVKQDDHVTTEIIEQGTGHVVNKDADRDLESELNDLFSDKNDSL